MSAWAARVRDLIARNADPGVLPYPDLGSVEMQLLLLGLEHFDIGFSDFSYEDGSTKKLIGFSGLIKSQEKQYAVVGWLTPKFPQTAPDLYVLPKYSEGVMADHRWVKMCGMVEIPYLKSWNRHSNLMELTVQLGVCFSEWPPLVKRPNPTRTVNRDIPRVITDRRIRKSLKQLQVDFPKLKVYLHGQIAPNPPLPFVSGYFPISHHSSTYKVLLHIRLNGFPESAPEFYIQWDRSLSYIKKDYKYVSAESGRILTPLLKNWSYREGLEDYNTLVGIVWNLVDLFSLDPPVRQGVCVPSTSNSGNSNEQEERANRGTAGYARSCRIL